MTRWADLHIHTFYSDSTSSPEEVVEQAVAHQLSCISITDHDTVDGVAPAMETAKKHGLEVLAGVEMSTITNGKDVHILGYGINHNSSHLLAHLKKMQESRLERMQEILDKLKALNVVDIKLGEVVALSDQGSIGRPHLAQILVQRGIVGDIKSAFNKYLADDAPAYVPAYQQTPQEAIAVINKAGGVAVMAHPMVTRVDELISGFVKEGLQGLEVYYPTSSAAETDFYLNLAKKYGLIVTGGSDAHGDSKKHTYVGKIKIPYDLVEQLKKLITG